MKKVKKFLYNIVIDDSTKQGKAFDYFIQVLIILSLVAFAIETIPGNSDRLIKVLSAFETFCVAIFSIE
jgi:voltage-gated potassium channel